MGDVFTRPNGLKSGKLPRNVSGSGGLKKIQIACQVKPLLLVGFFSDFLDGCLTRCFLCNENLHNCDRG